MVLEIDIHNKALHGIGVMLAPPRELCSLSIVSNKRHSVAKLQNDA
jgi:hypothetical protein